MAEGKARTLKAARRRRVKRSVRKRVHGTRERPRLTVFRSNRHIYAQLVDDISGTTLASASSLAEAELTGSSLEVGQAVGKTLAARAREAGIQSAIFDRNGYRYLGRVRALAEGAREGGLAF